jgi:hypothetical protein
MKLFVFLFLCAINSCFASQELYLRKLYYASVESKDSSEKFSEIMEALDAKKNPILLCFKGMSYMIQAKHSSNPFSKLSAFNKGKEFLDLAAKYDSEIAEVRFMRFAVQTNAPSMLNYNQHINEDKELLIKAWKTGISDLDLKQKIKEFMLKSTYCSAIEKSVFK